MYDFKLLDEDPKYIEDTIINAFNSARLEAGERALGVADPQVLFLKSMAYIITTQNVLINEAMRMNFVETAKGIYLDGIGKLTGTYRLEASKSSCIVKFTKVSGVLSKVLIPKGTRVTADSVVYFELLENIEIKEDEESVEAIVYATRPGVVGNNYGVDSIKQVVDSIAYIKSCTNITESKGGKDIEDDESYRERIFLAPETLSVAGPIKAYIYHVKSVSSDICDVAVTSPAPGVVKIYPLLENGILPERALLEDIDKKISADNVRPLTDKVEVLSPDTIEYNINLEYYLYQDRDPITQEKVDQVVSSYILWQKSKLGRDINPDRLISLLHELGIKRVNITEPVFQKLDNHQLAICVSASITFAGLEEE